MNKTAISNIVFIRTDVKSGWITKLYIEILIMFVTNNLIQKNNKINWTQKKYNLLDFKNDMNRSKALDFT